MLSRNINEVWIQNVYCLMHLYTYPQTFTNTLAHAHTHTHTHPPHSHCVVQLIIQTLPDVYVEKILKFLADRLDNSPHLEFYLHWCTKLLTTHGSRLKERSSSLMATIRDLQKSVLQKQKDLGKM